MAASKSILIVVTSHDRIDAEHATGLWFEEFAIPFQKFKARDLDVTVASVRGGQVPIDPRSMPDDEETPQTRTALDALRTTRPLAELNVSGFDAVFFPGGHGTMYDLPNSPQIADLVSRFMEQDKVVAAVCHGPSAFVNAMRSDGTPAVKGRKIAAFTNEEEAAVELDKHMPFLLESRLRELGAEVSTAPVWSDNVVVDGKLVTGQNPQSSATAADELMKLLS